MSESQLNKLFDQARKEAPETQVKDIQKWIGYVTIGSLLLGFFTKLKVVFTSKFGIMFYTGIVAVGIGIGTIILFGNDNQQGMEKSQVVLQELDSNQSKVGQTIELIDSNGNSLPKQTQKSESLQQNNPITRKTSPIEETTAASVNPSPLFPILPLRRLVENQMNQAPIATKNANEDYGVFDAIRVAGPINVIIEQGNKSDVSIDADELGKKILVIKNKNGTLDLSIDTKGKSASNFKLTVTITVKDLKQLECSGASNVKSINILRLETLKVISSGASDLKMNLEATHLKLSISGASDINFYLNCDDLDINSSGASDITLSGSANKLTLENSGATDFKGYDLNVKEATLDCSGASDTKVHVTEKLSYIVSGASDVKCKGKPSITSKSVTGASDFKLL